MKVHVYCDERYPDYGIDRKPHPDYPVVEVSAELVAEIDAADIAYRQVQGKLRELASHQMRQITEQD